MKHDMRVSLHKLREQPYASILCYPKVEQSELESRIKELEKLDVEALEFTGRKTAFNVQVLGKGYVGIVVVTYTRTGKAALKIRRMDADRAEMQHEAEMLKLANKVNVGPQLLNVTKNFLLMEFIEGKLLPEWIQQKNTVRHRLKTRQVLTDILEQCWRLDQIGLDHGELSRAHEHIIVDKADKPYILDFETASTNRRVSNVTSISQFLFIGSQIAKELKDKICKINQKELIHILKTYKQQPTRENFEKILENVLFHIDTR